MREPLDMIAVHGIKEMHWLWSPGGGKTTGIEGSIQWRTANMPSNILLVGQKDDTVERWMETRLIPSMKKNPELRDLVPKPKGDDRHRLRKTSILFDHGFYLEAVGSAESNLQERSMPLVILEEAWKLSEHKGRIQQAKQRTHDKWNAMILYAGQAGDTHYEPDKDDSISDLYREWKKTDQRVFSWQCRGCGKVHPFKWEQMKWDKVVDGGGETDWGATAETIRMECPSEGCDEKYYDRVSERREIAESGQYVVTNPKALKGMIGFQANAMCYWRIPWLKLVQQFDDAMEANYKGDQSLLRLFVIQRLAEFWSPALNEEEHDLLTPGYRIADYDQGQLIDNEEGRCITVDVQMADLWFTIAAINGESQIHVLLCGQAFNFAEIEELRAKYNVRPGSVLVDMKFRRDTVLQECNKYKWTAYRGVDRVDYLINVGDQRIRAPYSNPETVSSGSGKTARAINLCVNTLKDLLAEIRAGRAGDLFVPLDVDKRFRSHLNAERKGLAKDGRRMIWKQIAKRPNHLLDTAMTCVGYGVIKGLLKLPDRKEAREDEEEEG